MKGPQINAPPDCCSQDVAPLRLLYSINQTWGAKSNIIIPGKETPMKRLMMLFALFVLFVSSTLLAQDEEETLTTYFVDTPITVYISSSSIPWCQAALSFDLETINEDGFLDVAFGRAIGSSGPNRYGIENYNNGSGEFPNGDAEFFFRLGYCEVPSQINNLVFGKLRSNIPRKDLAFLSDDSTFIFLNTGNGLETPRNQALVGKATDGCWGPFNDADDYERSRRDQRV